uniref:Uncharacterized protein n=1 Tax=Steinernema glaseri TaxID=37863 RepID=A0A1I8APL5_9BILA
MLRLIPWLLLCICLAHAQFLPPCFGPACAPQPTVFFPPQPCMGVACPPPPRMVFVPPPRPCFGMACAPPPPPPCFFRVIGCPPPSPVRIFVPPPPPPPMYCIQCTPAMRIAPPIFLPCC